PSRLYIALVAPARQISPLRTISYGGNKLVCIQLVPLFLLRMSSAWSRARPSEASPQVPLQTTRRARRRPYPVSMSENEKPSRPPLVLLANDQEWSARSLESILGPNGYAVLRAYTGKQVLDLARSAQPDLVIMDIRLPDMDGGDVCKQLLDDVRFNASTPIIITTSGPAERSQRLAALQSGAWEFVSQPLDGEV